MTAERYPPIADYGLIGDCHAAALVSRAGSIDWCCLPRFDSSTTFGRLLDWDRGGFFSLTPTSGRGHPFRTYLDRTLVLTTTFRVEGGQARVIDFLALPESGPGGQEPEIIRVVEAERGAITMDCTIAPRFDYGEVQPWIRRHGENLHTAIGGDDGLLIWSEAPLEERDRRLQSRFTVRAGERVRFSLAHRNPADLPPESGHWPEPSEIDGRLESTIRFWRGWTEGLSVDPDTSPEIVRSAILLKALTHARTGAMVAAPTTSLPEASGGDRNWDYRYSWIRDSVMASRSLVHLGCQREAADFRRFIERSAAGAADDLQILYGVGGERRLDELELELEGYGGAGPARTGNSASEQAQLDVYGQLVDQSWRWYERGHEPDDDYWRFIVDLVNAAAERWREPDSGIWEWRGGRRHFTHSKAFCWAALDKGLALARACMRKAPEQRWREARDEIRDEIERRGYDAERGIFVQEFDEHHLDAALLRLPAIGFVDYEDERMVRTTDAIRDELGEEGLLRRYEREDALRGREGTFLPATFWLVEVLARQRRLDEARMVFDRAVATANGIGLFSEEYDPRAGEMLGNFPQALTHLSHIAAALALEDAEQPPAPTHAGASAE